MQMRPPHCVLAQGRSVQRRRPHTDGSGATRAVCSFSVGRAAVGKALGSLRPRREPRTPAGPPSPRDAVRSSENSRTAAPRRGRPSPFATTPKAAPPARGGCEQPRVRDHEAARRGQWTSLPRPPPVPARARGAARLRDGAPLGRAADGIRRQNQRADEEQHRDEQDGRRDAHALPAGSGCRTGAPDAAAGAPHSGQTTEPEAARL